MPIYSVESFACLLFSVSVENSGVAKNKKLKFQRQCPKLKRNLKPTDSCMYSGAEFKELAQC